MSSLRLALKQSLQDATTPTTGGGGGGGGTTGTTTTTTIGGTTTSTTNTSNTSNINQDGTTVSSIGNTKTNMNTTNTNIDRLSIKARMKASRNQSHNDNNDNDDQSISSEENEASLNDLDEPTDDDMDDDDSIDNGRRDDRRTSNTTTGITSSNTSQHQHHHQQKRHTTGGSSKNAAAHTIQKQYRNSKKKKHIVTTKRNDSNSSSSHAIPSTITSSTTTSIGRSKKKNSITKKMLSIKDKKKRGNINNKVMNRHDVATTDDDDDDNEDDQHDNDSHSNSNNSSNTDESTNTTSSWTVTPPTQEIIQHMQSLTIQQCQQHVCVGLRVKVLFDHPKPNQWYGGYIQKVIDSTSGENINDNNTHRCRIKIHYDDGTTEVTNFPDRKKKHTSSSSISTSMLPQQQQQQDTVIIDAQNNGQHPISTLNIAQFYIPSSSTLSPSLPSTKRVNHDSNITNNNHTTDIRIESSNPTDVPTSTVELKPVPVQENINDDTTTQQIEQQHQDDRKDEIQMNISSSSQAIDNNDNIQSTTTTSNDVSLPPSSSSFLVDELDKQTTNEALPSSTSDLNQNDNDDDVNIRHPIDTTSSTSITIPTETPITTSIQSTIVNVADNSNNTGSNDDTKNTTSNKNDTENTVFMDTDHSNTTIEIITDSNKNEVDDMSLKIPNSIRNEVKADIEMKQQNDMDLEMETNVDQPIIQEHIQDEIAEDNEPTEQQQQQSEAIVEPSSSSLYKLKENEIDKINDNENIDGSNNDKCIDPTMPSKEINVQNIDDTIIKQNDMNDGDNIGFDKENDTVTEQQSKDDNMTKSIEGNDRDDSIDATNQIIDDSNVAPDNVNDDPMVHLESANVVEQSNEVLISSSVDKDETHVPFDTTITEIDDQNNGSKSAMSDMDIDDPKNEVTTTTTDSLVPVVASDTMEHDAFTSNAIVDDNTTNSLQPQEKEKDTSVEEPTLVENDTMITSPAHAADTSTTGMMETDKNDDVVKEKIPVKSDLEGTSIHPDSNKELEHTLNPPTSEATVLVKETVTSDVNTTTVSVDKVSMDKVQSSVSIDETASQPSTISKSIDDSNISNSLDSHAQVDSSTSISNKRTSSDITDLSNEERPKKKLTIRIPIHKIKAKINQTDSDPSTSTTVTTPIISDKKKGTEAESYRPSLDGTDSKVTIANISKNDDDTQTVTSPRQLKKLQKLERKKKKLLLASAESKKEGVVSAGTNNTESISKVKKDRLSIDVSNNNVVQSIPSLDNSVYTPTNESNNDMDYLLDGTIRSERRAAQQANERIVAKPETILPKSSSLSTTTTTTASEEVIGKKKKKGVRRKEMDGDVVRKSSSKENENELDDSQWVQCDKCGKWRIIPNSVVQLLPKQWYCTDNIYDPKHNSCDAPEQTDKDVAREKKRRLKKKQRLLKAAEEAAAAAVASAEGIGQKQETSTVEGINQTTTLLQRSPKTPRETIDDIEKPTKQPKRLSSMDESKIPELPSMDARPGKQKEKKIPSLSGKRGRSVESMDKLVTVQEESIPAVVVGTDTAKPRGRGRPRRNNTNSNNNMNSNTKESNPTTIGGGSTQQQQSSSSALDDGENLEWVQCEKCDKWRKLPPHVSADDLPDVWTCNMNTWNPSSASCDAPEDKSDGLQDIGVFGTNGSSAGKLTYRHLIFGSTGRKANRPISEKTRAAESIFSLHFDDDDAPTKVLYADSSAYISRGRPNAIQVEENDNISFLELMNHSKLWQELRCIASPPPLSSLQQQLAHGSPNSVSAVGPLNDTLRMNPYTYETLPFDIQEAMKEYVLGFIDTDTLSGDEIVHRIQSSINPSSNTVINSNDGDVNNKLIKTGSKQLSMTNNNSNILQQQQQKVAAYCTEPVIITTVCHLVKIGRMECIQKRRISTSSTNTFSIVPSMLYYRRCIQRVTPTINDEGSSLYRNNNNSNNNIDDNNDKVDTTTSPTTGTGSSKEEQQQRRLSYPMKLSKPWKHTTITNM